MRELPAELPDDPTPAQVDAWVELAELIADPGFRQRARTMAVAGQQDPEPASELDYQAVQDLAGQALASGIAPASAEGQAVLDHLVPAAARPATLHQLQTFTDARVERYWQLLGIVNGRPPFPPAVPAFEWLIAALSAG